MQVILGSGGAIGNDLAKELTKYTGNIRLASRNPKKINDNDDLVRCDLLNADQVELAVKGCTVAYLTAGLPYKTKIWQEQWPVVMKNTIAACKKHKTKLVFFDNIYMYNSNKLNPMIEETEIAPVSKKGQVRAEITKMVLAEIKTGKLDALIARAADFYGPGITNSVFNEVVVKNLKAGKKANWFCSLNHLHNFTFTPDAAKATALLGNTESAFNQVWHLPTATPLTGKQWIEKVAKELGVKPKTQVASKSIIQFMGIFNSIMKEFVEMLYQWDRDYNFDSSKFETVFKIKATPVDEAIKQIIQAG
jgi:nucleoside-diphosphate-sugar epimerase